jgi:hypothetical protein
MYCSTCGRQITPGLTFCNHCGARQAEALVNNVKLSKISGDVLIWAMVGVLVFGLGLIIGLLAVLKEFNAPLGIALGVALSIFILMLLLEAVFTWQLFSNKRLPVVNEIRELKTQTTRELQPASALAEPLSSVTEHTTRNFVPLYNERKSE